MSHVRRRGLLAALVSLLACLTPPGLAACGGNGDAGGRTASVERTSPPPPEQLSAEARSTVRRAQLRIRSYCRQLILYVSRRRGPPTRAETARAYDAVDRLVAIARAKPTATVPLAGRTVRELLGDIAEDLEGSGCADNVVQRIDQALATLPPPQ